MPAAQLEHALAPRAEKVPEEHATQLVPLLLAWYRPASQLEHAVAPAAE